MKAVVMSGPGAEPRWEEFAEPQTGQGQQLVTTLAAGIHPVVRSRAAGHHYSSTSGWPVVAGVDAVGRTADGRLVYAGMAPEPWGTMAERFAPAMLLELEESADPVAVAASVNPALAGWMPLTARRAEIGELGAVMVLGASGASGRLAVASALSLGAESVVAVARNQSVLQQLAEDRVETVALTGDREQDATAIRAALRGRRLSTVLDFCWGPVAEAALLAVSDPEVADAKSGIVHVEIGTTAGEEARVPGSVLRSRRISLRGSGMGAFGPADLRAELPALLQAIGRGELVVPHRAFPVDEVARAWEYAGPERAVLT